MNFLLHLFLPIFGVIMSTNSMTIKRCFLPHERIEIIVSRTANNFSNNFFQSLLAEESSGNIICSPFSVYEMLSMLSERSQGETANELESVMNIPDAKCNADNGFWYLKKEIYQQEKNVDLELVNKIFIDSGLTVEPNYQNKLKIYHSSEVQNIDFSNPQEAAKTINDWYDKNTHGHIQNIVNSDDLNGVKTVLVSTIYLSGEWAHKFPSASTKKVRFDLSNTMSTVVNMMHVVSEFNHGRISGFKAQYVELYFNVNEVWSREKAITMFVIRPDSFDDLEHITKNFENINITQLNNEPELLSVYLPKFTIESKFDLKSPLHRMGINKIFSDSTELDDIVENFPLKIDKFIHKVVLNVHEAGTDGRVIVEGSANTASNDIPEFRADVPFLCVILDNETKTKLSIARINNPPEN